jgi:hypothetical protein
MTVRARDRIARLEARLPCPLPPAADAELLGLIRLMTFNELCAGQQAMLPYACDVAAGLEAGDPVLVAVHAAARARAAGIDVAELFSSRLPWEREAPSP